MCVCAHARARAASSIYIYTTVECENATRPLYIGKSWRRDREKGVGIKEQEERNRSRRRGGKAETKGCANTWAETRPKLYI